MIRFHHLLPLVLCMAAGASAEPLQVNEIVAGNACLDVNGKRISPELVPVTPFRGETDAFGRVRTVIDGVDCYLPISNVDVPLKKCSDAAIGKQNQMVSRGARDLSGKEPCTR